MGEPVRSGDAELPSAIWQWINGTCSMPLPLKIWAADPSIGRTQSLEDIQSPRPGPRPWLSQNPPSHRMPGNSGNSFEGEEHGTLRGAVTPEPSHPSPSG